MARFRVLVRSSSAPDVVLARLLDPSRHAAAVPLTAVRGSMAAPGDTFVARTSLGPIGFDDSMVVRSVSRTATGGRVTIAKTGRVVRGEVQALVRPGGPGALVEWEQDITVRGVPRLLEPFVAAAARAAYGAALHRIVG